MQRVSHKAYIKHLGWLTRKGTGDLEGHAGKSALLIFLAGISPEVSLQNLPDWLANIIAWYGPQIRHSFSAWRP